MTKTIEEKREYMSKHMKEKRAECKANGQSLHTISSSGKIQDRIEFLEKRMQRDNSEIVQLKTVVERRRQKVREREEREAAKILRREEKLKARKQKMDNQRLKMEAQLARLQQQQAELQSKLGR